MIRLATLVLALSVGTAQADFVLSDMVGSWSGSGSYSEALSTARMRCRITVTGTDAQIMFAGKCGSSLGAEDVVLEFTRQGSGEITVRLASGKPQRETEITQLSGRPTATQLIVSGGSGHDSASMQFVKNADGTLYFATKRKWQTGRSQSAVTLVAR